MAINDREDQVVRRYVRGDQPADIKNTEDLLKWLLEELDRVQEVSSELTDSAPQLAEAEPSSKRAGMIRYARAPWDPLGTGYEGYVVWNGTAWVLAFVSGSITAADVANVPAGTIVATDVQAAINELDTDVSALSAVVATKADEATTITAGSGLSGGGDLSANRTIDLDVTDLTAETTADDADLIAIYDDSATSHRKMTRGDFLSGLGGKVVQQVYTSTGTLATGATSIPNDNTVPQNTEGTEFMSLAITPTDAANYLMIEVTVSWAINASNPGAFALFQDSNASAIAAMQDCAATANVAQVTTFRHRMVAGTTSATTFKLRAGCSGAGTFTFNGVSGAARFGGVLVSSITITEIAP